MTLATGILVMMALAVGGTLIVAVLYAVLTGGRNWWRELLSVRMLPFLFLGLAVGATTFEIGLTAKQSSDEALRFAVEDIESDCDDQITLLLMSDATVFVDELTARNNLTRADLVRISEYLLVDEATIYDREGRVVCTTDPGLKVGDMPFTWNRDEMKPFRELFTGKRRSIRQRFRPNVSAPDRIVKYYAQALPQGGAIQVGFLWKTFESAFPRFFREQFEVRAVGESGFCLVFDGQGRLVQDALGHPGVSGMSAREVGLTPEHLAAPLGTIFRARLFGTPCRCMFYREPIADLKVMAAIPISEGQGETLALAGGVAFVLFAAFLVFRLVLRKLHQQQAKIDALRMTEEKHRAADLALARAIQQAELRTDGTEGQGYRLATFMKAAREVGGDFYDYYELPDGRLVLAIADVSGKGVPAAFFMMKARMALKSCVYSSPTLAEAVAKANVRLAAKNPAEMFVTAWVGIYDRKTGVLDYVSAGHNPPLKMEEGGEGSVTWVSAPRCAALGVFEMAKYRGAQITLAAGDRLFLYTDGVTEAMNKTGELFGNARLETTLNGTRDSLVSVVRDALENFVDGAEQSDDITMMELYVKPTAEENI